ncbi:GNAT family N-acetyltransferase [Paenalcaligenes niemegkensis]|uniref:GNAT family N-acetyltransferase n=1 Tax=Paenalcaligenes niemegkensis TaxID=2895469 RepID=UPI001EE7C7D3|nr:GNAT family N-acetyltransferase [Paenalcaligenes niemegkensis]MCQ9615655.1 GNAT family N-acetyltransferase [Paenalcaligenes niemegkensis]
MSITYSLIHSADAIHASEWDKLAQGEQLLSHAFFSALETSPNACAETGWMAHHLIARDQHAVVGILPLYLKNHSRGEYVFDQGWANAYHQHGHAYYPRLISAVPYTPVGGDRLLATSVEAQESLLQKALEISIRNKVPTLHLLFPNIAQARLMEDAGLLVREAIQFHWKNRDYRDFDDFLDALRQKYRKKLRQDSRKVAEAGVLFQHLSGDGISQKDLAFFYECYRNTYLVRGQLPYLNLDFFHKLLHTMPEALVLIIAMHEGRPVASALSLRSGNTLYGRYWGSVQEMPGLHFETCYIQSIRYCIENSIQTFEGGAQGEHKLSRGLEPVTTYSAHWIADPDFKNAIADFVLREKEAVRSYKAELKNSLPFKA